MSDRQKTQHSGIIVRKYGGSSLATVDRIRTVAQDIRRVICDGYQVVVVVSAMGETTNELETLARQANAAPPRRELDMLLSVGERITMSLLSMALAAEGCPAISLTGSQCGIITDTSHTDARILEVKGDRVRQGLQDGNTIVVAGFQGVSREREITTLGRGGSDTTAVALAAALKARRCEILKDVDGVLTADPRQVPSATCHDRLSWQELRQIASSGCGVVHLRAVEYAAQHQVPLYIRSSFHDGPGTHVGPVMDAPASDRENRFRPLVLTVDHPVSRLRLSTTDVQQGQRLLDLVLCHLNTAQTIGEWLDSGDGFRWEVLAPQICVAPLIAALSAIDWVDDQAVLHEPDLTCISLTGGRPDSWLEVQRHLATIMGDLEVRDWRLRADGSALRVLIPDPAPKDLPQRLHDQLIGG